MANKHLLNGVIKSEPKSWSDEEISKMLELKKQGHSFDDIGKILGRTAYSCNRKYYKLMKKLDTYNDKHRDLKYDYNKQFSQKINAESLLDAFSGGVSWWKKNTELKVIDNDIKIEGADYKLDAFDFLYQHRKKQFDIVDLNYLNILAINEDMEHTNKIAIKILRDNYSDYPENSWHYDKKYKMIVEGIEMSKRASNDTQIEGEWVQVSDGDANFYTIVSKEKDKTRWLFRIQQNGELTVEQQQCNINLILAAPELLEALIRVSRINKTAREHISDNVFEQVEAAIKKATE
jgi:hypothetical protein